MMGQEEYAITGQIQCPNWGLTCSIDSGGGIFLDHGATYDIVWQDQGNGFCAMELHRAVN